MSSRTPRRSFLKQVAAISAVPFIGTTTRPVLGANDRVHIACIGVSGKGESDLDETSRGHQIVALCDIDEQSLERASKKFPQATKYTDWRKLLEQRDIDAVTVSTPDHTHAPATMAAMGMGKHAFTQKPLTHSVYEARRMAEVAAKNKLITQMGIQHHATARLKKAVIAIQDGMIGKVSEVHAWTDRPGDFWRQGLQRPAKSDAVPGHVHWNEWLGVAPERPYVAGIYHPFNWRGWWDFGTGALGDMGCHILDPVVGALKLGPPRLVWADGPPPHADSGPLWCEVHYEFPGTQYTTESVKLTWYEASRQPPREIFQAPADWKGSRNGILYRGEKGNLFVGFPEMPELFPQEKFAGYKFAEVEDHDHYSEWTGAIPRSAPTSCPFSYSGPLTETVLLGNVAYRSGKKIEWDSAALKAKGVPEADPFIRRTYREGWEVIGL